MLFWKNSNFKNAYNPYAKIIIKLRFSFYSALSKEILSSGGQSNTRPLTQGLHCPSGWNKLDDACYRVYGNIYSVSWSQANSVCNASRATLVSILSQSEHNAVWELMKAHTRRNYGFWIGLKRSSTKAFAFVFFFFFIFTHSTSYAWTSIGLYNKQV